MPKTYLLSVKLSQDERDHLFSIIHKGIHNTRMVTRARILYKIDKGQSNQEVCFALDVTLPTVLKTRKRYAEGGLGSALGELPRLGSKPKLDEKQAAMVTAIACSQAPDGHCHWTLRMLGAKIIELGFAQSYSHESVRQLLKKNELKPWQKQEWCITKVDEEFVACMEDVIETYMLPLDKDNPVICFDESPFQLLAEVREPIPATPGHPRREDCEYERCGVVEAMMICQPAAGLRKCMLMEHRKKSDFAAVCKEVDRMFPDAKKITLICDNLNTHTKGALYTVFPAEEARRLAKRIEIKHTPKHGSWLNIAELEFAVLGRTVFKKRISDTKQLQRELDAICGERNAEGKPVRWQFNLGVARKKMAWAYPGKVKESA